jgi:hypothetical protein
MTAIESPVAINDIDQRIEDLLEPVMNGTADERGKLDFATLSAMRVRMMLPPEIAEIEKLILEY